MNGRVSWIPMLLVGLLAGAPTVLAQSDVLGGDVKVSTPNETEIKATIERLHKDLRANPKNYRIHFDLANAYAELEDEENARDHYEAALAVNPKFLEALVNFGTLYTDLNQPEEAIPYFEKALGLNPDDCKARSNLGNAYYALERYADAMYEYNKAVEADAKCHSALYNIAVAFADAGLYRDAVKWWKKVEKAAPGTEAARSARENIELLRPFTQPPSPAGGEGTKEN